ncbi:MAG: ATP-binding protein [Aquabacterium sp.]
MPHSSSSNTPPRDSAWFDGPALTDLRWQEDDPSELDTPDITEDLANTGEPTSAPTATVERPNTFFRIYRAFLTARAALSITLLAGVIGSWLFGSRPTWWMVLLAAVYAITNVTWWAWPSERHPKPTVQPTLRTRQALATIGLDLCTFALLHHLASAQINSQALLILPVLMAAVLMNRTMAMGVAAAATLNLLAAAWLQYIDSSSPPSVLLTQAGLTGFGLFAIALLASELSTRLAREERTAQGSREQARHQAELNKLVIEQMVEGVLVVDRIGRVRTANPSARRLLAAAGQTAPAPFQLRGVPAWKPLIEVIEHALHHPQHAEDGLQARLRFSDDTQRLLKIRIRFTRGPKAGEDVCVMFLEDVRTLQQRLRQDKLAAMGRMSAGIAHEIRNPLAAISQANALLAEDLNTPTQIKLTQMVQDNVNRLKHIVDDILAVAPGARPPAPIIDALGSVKQIAQEWARTHGLQMAEPSDPAALLVWRDHSTSAPNYPHLGVRFELEHLQRVLINLLDNALRYNSGAPGSIIVQLTWRPEGGPQGQLRVSVCSDGEPIGADIERSLFEPFFSTSSRGTGLGLYISRELCERHGAHIDYQPHPSTERHRNEFFVSIPIEPPHSLP